LELARQWFTKLLDRFPSDRKVPDAKFKLGKVYDLMGDKVKAKALLEEVAASNTDAARLAKKYLQQDFHP
jgi:TolA-binding protein